MKRLIKNAARCKLCDTIIESRFRHDFQACPCGEIFVDGGLDYVRRGGNDLDNIEELSEWEETENETLDD